MINTLNGLPNTFKTCTSDVNIKGFNPFQISARLTSSTPVPTELRAEISERDGNLELVEQEMPNPPVEDKVPQSQFSSTEPPNATVTRTTAGGLTERETKPRWIMRN